MWPFNRKIINTRLTAQKALGTAGVAPPEPHIVTFDQWPERAATIDQSRFTREERSTPAFHLKNIDDILESLRTSEAGIVESMEFERERHAAEMIRLETNLSNVHRTIAGYEAATMTLRATGPVLMTPAAIDPARMSDVGRRIAEAKLPKPRRARSPVPKPNDTITDADGRATQV